MKVEILRTPAEWEAPDVQGGWRRLCAESGRLQVLYQSPEWLAHLCATKRDGRNLVVVVRDAGGAIAGVAPLRIGTSELDYTVGARVLHRVALESVVVLGGEPLVADDAGVYERLLGAIWPEAAREDCVSLPMLPRQSACWRLLAASPTVARAFIFYAPAIPGSGMTHALRLPATFDEYLATQFSSKQRNNIKRRLKLMDKELGAARLERCRAVDEVARFVEAVRPIDAASWQHAAVGAQLEAGTDWREKLEDLARRGLLRSYLLFAGERPSAFVLGYQGHGVFYHVKTGYDRSLARYAPGIAILHHLLRDLYADDTPAQLSFGFGDADYKREWGNVESDPAPLFLLNRSVKNRMLAASHAALRGAVGFARAQVRRFAPLKRPTVATAGDA